MASTRIRGRRAVAVGTDAHGNPDPTQNVLALVEAANQRQDDLREMNNAWIDSRLTCQKEMADLREQHAQEVYASKAKMADLRELHSKEAAVAEANRLNAVRQVDQLNVSTAAAQALAAIQALAAETARNAENIRTTMTATAAAIATQTTTTVGAITERLASLEKLSYTGQGKGAGISASWGVILGVATLISILLGFGIFIYGSAAPDPPLIINVPTLPVGPVK